MAIGLRVRVHLAGLRYDGRDVSKREWMVWILKARIKVNSELNIFSVWVSTGLVPFNSNRVLG